MQRASHLLKNTQLFTRTYVFRTATSNAATREEHVELKSWKEIPGPSSLPLVGPLRHFAPGGFLYKHAGTELTQKLYETYGDVVRFDALPGMTPMVFLFDPESVAKVIREEDTYPVRTRVESMNYYRTINNRLLGLVADGEPWKKFRTMVNPVLLMPKTIRLYAGTLDTVALDMVERIRKMKDVENKIQNTFLHEIKLWSLESIGTVTLGCRIGCFEPNLHDDSPASKMIECSQALTMYMNKLDFKPSIWKYVTTNTFKKAMKNYEEHEKLCKYYINKSKNELMNSLRSDDEKGILEKLLEIDEDVANVMGADMMIAGVDTCATPGSPLEYLQVLCLWQELFYVDRLLSKIVSRGNIINVESRCTAEIDILQTAFTMIATLYSLAANPEKQHKLREELKSEQRAYLKACIKESIRVMPVGIGNGRVLTKECSLLGYKIPTGVNAIFVHQDMSVMEKHFIKPKEYIPERWLADTSDPLCYKNAHPFAYMPFGFGVRSCIGRRIVELQLETFLTRAIENFHWEWNGPPPKIHAAPVNVMEKPYNFKIHDLKM